MGRSVTQAYTVRQVAALLNVPAGTVREAAVLVHGQPRDLFSSQDLKLLRRALEPERGQQRFDFDLPRSTRSRPMQTYARDAEQLFAAAVRLEEAEPGSAVEAYAEALAANPMHADAHVNLGRLLHQRGQLREAEAHYVAALVSRPDDVTATFNLAVVLEDLGRSDEAIARYCETIALDPHCVDAYFNLARLYEKKGEKMAAIRHLKDYRRLSRG